MSLYVDHEVFYRIWDPVKKKYCKSGCHNWRTTGRSFWASGAAAGVARANMPDSIKGRLIIHKCAFVRVLEEDEVTEIAPGEYEEKL